MRARVGAGGLEGAALLPIRVIQHDPDPDPAAPALGGFISKDFPPWMRF